MGITNPKDWGFLGWFALRIPWVIDYEMLVRIGNAITRQFPNMSNASFEENERRTSFTEYEDGLVKAAFAMTPMNVSFRLSQIDRADEWKSFSQKLVSVLSTETDIFLGVFNISQIRQSVYIPIRGIPNPGKRLYEFIGNHAYLDTLGGKERCQEIGIDHEFVITVDGLDWLKLILRLQTQGPTATWLNPGEILVTSSAILDTGRETIDNIAARWQQSQKALLEWLSDSVNPSIIEPLIGNTGHTQRILRDE